VETANIYEPDHLIGHPEFRPGSASSSDSQHPHQPSPAWLARSLAAWEEVLAATPARLYLENTRDQTPEALLALLDLLPPDRAALCFDLGHWFVAAADFQTLPQWLEQTADRLGHLHLHDNCGRFDQHLGLGQGLIDFQPALKFLAERNLSPTFTLEAHDPQALDQSLAWLAGLPAGPLGA
jgi:sugar phosphate isomerase/epimerase